MTDLTEQIGFAGDMARMIANKTAAPQVLDNTTRECAAEAIQQMLDQASKKVCVYCHCLANDIYDRNYVVCALQNAYKRNSNLDFTLFVRDEYPTYNRFLTLLLRNGAKIARDMTHKISVAHIDSVQKQIPDFFAVDDQYIRVEVSEEDRSAKVHKNNQTINDRVNAYADYLMKVATSTPLL